MLEYIKMIILAILTGVTAPLPVSSAAHYNFLTNVIGIPGDNESLVLYYSGFLVAFAVMIIINFRKIFGGCIKAALVSKKDKAAFEATKGYRFIAKNIGVSILPTLVLFVPVSKDKLLIDFFDSFLGLNGILLSGFACIVTALVLVVALWYTKNKTNKEEQAGVKTALRLSLYQLPCYIIPGFSHIASGAVNMLICDAKKNTFMSELYVYLAPSMLIVGLVKMIRIIAGDLIFDPIILIVSMVVFALAAKLIIRFVSKTNISRMLGLFCVYSLVYGIFIAVASFNI